MQLITLTMSEDVAEIVMAALVIYAELLATDGASDDDQEDIDRTISQANQAATAICQTVNQNEVRH